jgi:O-antigen/teichoic acid export membrane protein
VRKYIVPVVSRYGAAGVQFLLVWIVTRVLSPSDAGHYFVIIGVVLTSCGLAGIGIPDGLVRIVPQIDATGDAEKAASVLRWGLRSSLVFIPVGAVLCAVVIAAYYGSWLVAALAGVVWAGYAMIVIAAQVTVASGRSSQGTAMFYSAVNFGQLVVTVPLIATLGLDRIESVLLSTVAGTSLAAFLCIAAAWRISRHGAVAPNEYGFRVVWRQGAPMTASRVVQACLVWSPVWIASVTLGAAAAGQVGLASRLAVAVGALIAAVRFAIRPRLARLSALGNWQDIERAVSKIALLATALAMCAAATAALVGVPIISAVFGADYGEAAPLTALMLVGTIGESIGGPVDEVLKMSGKAALLLVVQTIAVIVGFGAQLVAGRFGGAMLLVAVYAIVDVLMYVAFIVIVRRLRGIWALPRWVKSASSQPVAVVGEKGS